jgi:hypothetical protein
MIFPKWRGSTVVGSASRLSSLRNETRLKKVWRLFFPDALSLSLTLSRWEREQPLDAQLTFVSHRAKVSRYFSETLEPILPLPGGVATATMAGEGERDTFTNCPAWKMFAAFPLTLTLSPAERKQPLSTPLKSESYRAESSRRFTKTLGAFLPLPAGAATAAMAGEGERFSFAKRLRNKLSRAKKFCAAALLVLLSFHAAAENIFSTDPNQLLERTCFQTVESARQSAFRCRHRLWH